MIHLELYSSRGVTAAWNVCQLFPPFSGNSLLPSSAQVLLAFFSFLIPAFESVGLQGRSHRLFVFPHDSSVRYFSSYGFLPFFQRTGKAKNTVKNRQHRSESLLLPFHVQVLNSKKLKIQKEILLPWEGRQRAPHRTYFYSRRNAIFPLFL